SASAPPSVACRIGKRRRSSAGACRPPRRRRRERRSAMQELKDRVAVVTGAASGIGRGIARARAATRSARALAAKHCSVVLADVDVAGAEMLARELRERGVRSLALHCDVTDPAAL